MRSSSKWLNTALDDIDSAKIMLRESKYNNVCYFSFKYVIELLSLL